MTRYPLKPQTLHDVENEYLESHGFHLSSNGTEWTKGTADGGYVMIWNDGLWNIMYKPAVGGALASCGEPGVLVFTAVINWIEDNAALNNDYDKAVVMGAAS